LHVPASYHAGQPAPLVLGFHGNTGHADGYEAYTGFSTVSEQAGFIIAYAQGAGSPPTWDTWQGSKDVRYTSDLIDRLETICSIDSARVYATGFSLGGGMVDRLACDLSGRIAAVGAVSGAYINSQPCSPTQPVAVIAMHGTADSEVFYNGMPPAGTTPQTYFSISQPIPQWAQEWAQRNGCSEKASIFFRQDPVSGQRWDRCATGADVIFYTIRDGPHAWPDRTAGFIAEQIIWDFFSSHPLVRSSDFSRSPGSIQANSLP
jgi:polyhydroxybutyrate depolymerase